MKIIAKDSDAAFMAALEKESKFDKLAKDEEVTETEVKEMEEREEIEEEAQYSLEEQPQEEKIEQTNEEDKGE